MYLSLLLILLPLILGYFVVLSPGKWLTMVNRGCSYMVYLILFLMGISLSLLDNLGDNALIIVGYSALFTGLILSANVAGLWWFDWRARRDIATKNLTKVAKLPLIRESLTLLMVVFLGFGLGMLLMPEREVIDTLSGWALMLLLAFVGCQLRNSGIPLREILLNKQGMLIALVVTLTSWAAGAMASVLLSLPVTHGLAISSGFGWYSLSGILISDGISPIFGAVAFVSDLARELVAILLIPLLIQRYRLSAIGLGGATAMDFTLPIIQKSGGNSAVPLAIVSGFILSLASPLAILLFINF